MTWLTLECESAHYVMRGRETIICDRLPHPVTLVVKLAPIEASGRDGEIRLDPEGTKAGNSSKGQDMTNPTKPTGIVERLRALLDGITPGPWNVQRDGQIWCDDHPIVEKMCSGPWGDVGVDFFTGKKSLVHWWGTVATDEAKANARLIAEAPERIAEAADTICNLVALLTEARIQLLHYNHCHKHLDSTDELLAEIETLLSQFADTSSGDKQHG